MSLVNLPSRKRIAQALEDVIVPAASAALGGIDILHSRRLRGFDEIEPAQMPAIFLHQLAEMVTHDEEIVGIEPTRTMHFEAWVYTAEPQADSVVGIDQLDDIVDAIEQALTPGVGTPSGLTNICNLGGLVKIARISGAIRYSPAMTDGKSVAIVPIAVLRP